MEELCNCTLLTAVQTFDCVYIVLTKYFCSFCKNENRVYDSIK